jgi:hypothetical protein
MYTWKEIALMYKEEANRLCDEVHEALGHVTAKVPHSITKAENVLKSACIFSDKQLEFIESFESSVGVSKTPVSKVVGKGIAGRFINRSGLVSEKEYEHVDELCRCIYDTKKRAYAFMDKVAVQATINWLQESDYPIITKNLEKIKNNTIVVKDKSGKEKRVKVIASGLQFSGRTCPFGSEEGKQHVDRQYTYLVDTKESVSDMYVFVNYLSKNNELTLYAWVKGSYIKDMLVEPLRERFVGKMGCILQKQSYNSNEERPFSIDEIIRRS